MQLYDILLYLNGIWQPKLARTRKHTQTHIEATHTISTTICETLGNGKSMVAKMLNVFPQWAIHKTNKTSQEVSNSLSHVYV